MANKSKKVKKANKVKYHKDLSDRQKAYKIISRIYHELRKKPDIFFKKLKCYQGLYDLCSDEITIDYRKEVIPTLIHEYIHKFHPDKSEGWVINMEKFVVRRLSKSQAKRLLQYLSFIV